MRTEKAHPPTNIPALYKLIGKTEAMANGIVCTELNPIYNDEHELIVDYLAARYEVSDIATSYSIYPEDTRERWQGGHKVDRVDIRLTG